MGSLELLPTPTKIELGGMLLDVLPKRKMEPCGRPSPGPWGGSGHGTPVYGPLNTVVPGEVVAKWLRRMMDAGGDEPMVPLAVMQMARRTDDRYRDLAESPRSRCSAGSATRAAPAHFVELVRDGGRLDTEEQGLVFGESLPKGLRLA